MNELAAIRNPFRDFVVQDAWQSPADIPEIHASAFKACLAGLDSAASGVADSLLIYGGAGSGKTHLLTRLQRHLAQTAVDAPDQVLRCVFVFVRLQTAPQLLWQHVRRRLATDLLRWDQGLTQLQRLLAHQIGVHSGKPPREAVQLASGRSSAALAQHIAEISIKLNLPRDLSIVIEHLALNRFLRDAGGWLAGDSLPESALNELGLGADVLEDREEAARAAVTALCRLAGETLPIVFCFDQVEALQRSPGDVDAFFRFGQMAADLHDTDPNVFIVTCLQSAVLEDFKKAVRDADYQRIAKRHAVLDDLDSSQIERLLIARLSTAADLAPLRSKHPQDPFYPLPKKVVSELRSASRPVARWVLTTAGRRFEELGHGKLDRPNDEEYLAEQMFLRQETAKRELKPSDTHRVLIQGIELMGNLAGVEVRRSAQADTDLVVGPEKQRQLAVSIRNEADGRVLTPRLKRLVLATPRQDRARLIIVRDPRLPIPKAAVKAREHLAQLQRAGATLVEPTLAALAALEALQSLFADAKSGDLANDGTPLPENTVLEWLRRLRQTSDLSIEPIAELIDAIAHEAEPGTPNPEEQDLAELLARLHVVELGSASQSLGYSHELLLGVARKNAERFLVLEGPPVVLLDVAGTTAEMGALA